MKKKRKEEEADRGSHRRPCLGGSGGLQPNAPPLGLHPRDPNFRAQRKAGAFRCVAEFRVSTVEKNRGLKMPADKQPTQITA